MNKDRLFALLALLALVLLLGGCSHGWCNAVKDRDQFFADKCKCKGGYDLRMASVGLKRDHPIELSAPKMTYAQCMEARGWYRCQ